MATKVVQYCLRDHLVELLAFRDPAANCCRCETTRIAAHARRIRVKSSGGPKTIPPVISASVCRCAFKRMVLFGNIGDRHKRDSGVISVIWGTPWGMARQSCTNAMTVIHCATWQRRFSKLKRSSSDEFFIPPRPPPHCQIEIRD